jgi:hypothetical protein
MSEEERESDDSSKKRIQFDFIKAPGYRLIHADGAWGGLTTQGYVYMALYAERPSIPQSVVGTVSDDGNFVEISEERIARQAVIRDVEVGVLMDIDTAVALRKWLDEKIRVGRTILAGVAPPIVRKAAEPGEA